MLEHQYCHCLEDIEQGDPNKKKAEPEFHSQMQDSQSKGWQRVLELIDTAGVERWEEFAPFHDMKWEHRSEVITLPATIGKLKAVARPFYGLHVLDP